jgi:hypothetical protein
MIPDPQGHDFLEEDDALASELMYAFQPAATLLEESDYND